MTALRDFSTRPRAVRRRGDALAAALGVIVFLASAGYAFQQRTVAARAQERLAGAREDLARVAARAQSQSAPGSHAEEMVGAQAFGAVYVPPPVFLAALDKLLPADVKLVNLILNYGKQLEVEMRVAARRPEAYDEFLARLSHAPAFRDVVPGAERREGSLQATVRARFGSRLE